MRGAAHQLLALGVAEDHPQRNVVVDQRGCHRAVLGPQLLVQRLQVRGLVEPAQPSGALTVRGAAGGGAGREESAPAGDSPVRGFDSVVTVVAPEGRTGVWGGDGSRGQVSEPVMASECRNRIRVIRTSRLEARRRTSQSRMGTRSDRSRADRRSAMG
ncbi:hypothetical protein SHKM778_64650 [Streptomyces sp. KM77-8]|uniref:Uncharacterized protein n=1 Tax=Streptomyces haneummycinicus TaxID=3074435 RepID=A0AAT9HRJ2_9ACTN